MDICVLESQSAEKSEIRSPEIDLKDGAENIFESLLMGRIVDWTLMSFLDQFQTNFIEKSSTKKLTALWTFFLGVLKSFLRGFLLLLVAFYRVVLSPYLGGFCRFEPSCSVYAEQALKELSLKLAVKQIVQRILKCRPGGPYGPDPVQKCGCHYE